MFLLYNSLVCGRWKWGEKNTNRICSIKQENKFHQFIIFHILRNKVYIQIMKLQWNLSIADTIGTSKKCPLQRGVRYIEVLLKLALLLQIPAPTCIQTSHPYIPIGLCLLKLVPSWKILVPRTSPKDPIWPFWGGPDLTFQRRPNLTS